MSHLRVYSFPSIAISGADAVAGNAAAARIEEQKAEPGYVMNKVDYFVNHCTSTYLCKRAFMKTLEVHEASTGTKFGLKERQELYVAIVADGTIITSCVQSRYH